MKKYFIIIFVLIAQITFSQNTEETIKETFDTYVGLTKELKFNEAMDYVIEDMFKLVPRFQLIKIFKETFTSDEYDIEFVDYYVNNFKKPFTYKGATYVVFTNIMGD